MVLRSIYLSACLCLDPNDNLVSTQLLCIVFFCTTTTIIIIIITTALCEYFTPTETIPTCSLQCQNRGTCRKGVKDFGTLKDFDPSLSSIIQNNHTADFEHCICPDGYTGLTCEIELDTCPNGEHVCLHGSECQRKGGEHTCACDTAYTMFNRFAGKHCEHASTSIRTANGEPGVGRDEEAFCVNSGICRGTANGNG